MRPLVIAAALALTGLASAVYDARAVVGGSGFGGTVRFQRCLNFQATYSGAYLVDHELFVEVNFRAVGALEFASRWLWIHSARGKLGKDTGCAFKPAVGDEDTFAILHLSGIEHQLVRRNGYGKGIASMERLSYAVLAEQGRVALAAHGSGGAPGPHNAKPLGRYVTLIPFYGGQGFKPANSSAANFKPEYEAKVGNSHTLASPTLKLVQLASVVCSCLQHTGAVVVGVCSDRDKASIEGFFASEAAAPLPEWCRSPGGSSSDGPLDGPAALEIEVLPCEALPVFLPYRLLQWGQAQFTGLSHDFKSKGSNAHSNRFSAHAGHVDGGVFKRGAPPDARWAGRFQGVYFTEADNVLIMGAGDGMEGSVAAQHRAKYGHGGDADGSSPGAAVVEGKEVLTAAGIGAIMAGRGRDCYLAPSRYEKKAVGNPEDPFGGRVLIGQNVCSEGPDVVSVP